MNYRARSSVYSRDVYNLSNPGLTPEKIPESRNFKNFKQKPRKNSLSCFSLKKIRETQMRKSENSKWATGKRIREGGFVVVEKVGVKREGVL